MTTRPVPVRRSTEASAGTSASVRPRRFPVVYAYREEESTTTAAAVGIRRNEPLEAPAGARPNESGTFPSDFQNTGKHSAAKGLTAAALANRFNGDTVEHRVVHEQTGVVSTLYGSVIGATVYARGSPGSEDENRLILQPPMAPHGA